MKSKLLLGAALVALFGLMDQQKAHAQADTVSGGSLYFNGFSSYVDTRFTEHLKKFTVEAWVKSPNAPSGNQGKGPVHYENNFQINWDHVASAARGALVLKDSLGGWHAASFGTLEGNRWYHLAATYDGDTLKAYKNGELITANGAPTGPPTPETFSLKLGKHAKLSNPQFEFHEGEVDEVRIWERVLTAHELRQYMHLTRQGNESGLKLYYQLNKFQADSTLEVVSGRYSARLVQNPTRKTSTVAAASGLVQTRRFKGANYFSLPNGGWSMGINAADSATLYMWKLHEGFKGDGPAADVLGLPYQYIWRVYDTTSTYAVDNMRIQMDAYIDTALNRYGASGLGLWARPHYADGPWTLALDTVSGVAWGSGFLVFNGSIPAGQVLVAANRLVSIPNVMHPLEVQIGHATNAWILKRSQPDVAQATDVLICDQLGRKVCQVVWSADEPTLTVTNEGLSSGIYLLQIVENGRNHRGKLLK